MTRLESLYRLGAIRDDEACEILNIGKRQLRNLLRDGKLERFGPTRFRRITCQSIVACLNLPREEPDLERWELVFCDLKDCWKLRE